MKKPLALLAGATLFISMAHGFASGVLSDEKTPDAELVKNLNARIFPGSGPLSSSVLVIKSKKDAPISGLRSVCPSTTKTLYTNTANPDFNLSIIEIAFPSGGCVNGGLQIFTQSGAASSPATLPLEDADKQYSQALNFSSRALETKINKNNARLSEIDSLLIQKKQSDSVIEKLERISLGYEKHAAIQDNALWSEILEQRNNLTYLVPVRGKQMPSKLNKIPNTGRPYRADITDGIHRWWDVDAPIGTTVQAMTDGVIIRIVDGFVWSNFDHIKRGKNLTDLDRAKNLDILRGNQIWLKTIDGNVVFYSHLSDIEDDLYLGKRVSRGMALGRVGKTGVPDRDYTDTHLHFEVMVSPQDGKEADQEAMMLWKYLGQGVSQKGIFSIQNTLFRTQ